MIFIGIFNNLIEYFLHLQMYDFEGDYETVYTGENDLRLSGLLATYRGSRYLPQWPGNEGKCGDIMGASDGTKYSSFIEPGDKQKFYRKSMCRPADMIQIGEENIKGLNSYIYTFEDDAFDNGWRNEDHKCYCRKGKKNQQYFFCKISKIYYIILNYYVKVNFKLKRFTHIFF